MLNVKSSYVTKILLRAAGGGEQNGGRQPASLESRNLDGRDVVKILFGWMLQRLNITLDTVLNTSG